MNVMNEILEKKIFTQEKYEEYIRSCMSWPGLSEEKKQEYEKDMNGGKCGMCGQEWNRVEVNTRLANYFHFRPSCECSKNKDKEKRMQFAEKQVVEQLGIPEKYAMCTLRNMDVNVKPDTAAAIEEAKRFYLYGKFKTGGLVLSGPVGVGKTHMAVAILKGLAIAEHMRGRFVCSSDIIADTINEQKDYIKYLTEYDAVLLDDFDKLATNKASEGSWTYERIFSLINGLTNRNRIILITCNYASEGDFKSFFGEAISSRIHEACLFLHVPGENYRMRDVK